LDEDIIFIEQELTEMYKELNVYFFNGRLPNYIVRFIQLEHKKAYLNTKDKTVDIDMEKIREQELRRILLHEMCHFKSGWHGQIFQAELRRLHEMGEQWVDDEIKMIKQGNWNLQMKNLKDIISDLAYSYYNDFQQFPSFEYVLNECSLHSALKPDILLKKAPWLPRTWENKMKEAEDYYNASIALEFEMAKDSISDDADSK